MQFFFIMVVFFNKTNVTFKNQFFAGFQTSIPMSRYLQ